MARNKLLETKTTLKDTIKKLQQLILLAEERNKRLQDRVSILETELKVMKNGRI